MPKINTTLFEDLCQEDAQGEEVFNNSCYLPTKRFYVIVFSSRFAPSLNFSEIELPPSSLKRFL